MPTDWPDNIKMENSSDKCNREFVPHIIGHCGVCGADNQDITIGRAAIPMIQCPTCRARFYRTSGGGWLSDKDLPFVVERNDCNDYNDDTGCINNDDDTDYADEKGYTDDTDIDVMIRKLNEQILSDDYLENPDTTDNGGAI
jgi:hypothetical protein